MLGRKREESFEMLYMKFLLGFPSGTVNWNLAHR